MLYFAYGSNLYHKQMKKRCKDSVYIRCYILKNYRLFFRNNFLGGGVADIQRKNKSKVLGALYKISKRDEKKLDVYEDFPILYKKYYFLYEGKNVMTYTMTKKTPFRFPTERYLNIVKRGYKDCKLDLKFLEKALIK